MDWRQSGFIVGCCSFLHLLALLLFIMANVKWNCQPVVWYFRVISTTLIESQDYLSMFPAFYLFNMLLCILQVLHIFWSYLILRMVYSYVFSAKVGWPTNVRQTNVYLYAHALNVIRCSLWNFFYIKLSHVAHYLPILNLMSFISWHLLLVLFCCLFLAKLCFFLC